MNNDDFKTVQAMIWYGGSFVSTLGRAALCADDDNLRRIKETWPEYWQRYSDMAASCEREKELMT